VPEVSANKTSIGVTAFKAQCLGLIDDVAQGKTGRIVLLKHNRPIAAVVPLLDGESDDFDLWGAMRGTVKLLPGVDVAESTGVTWDALKEIGKRA